MVPTFLTAEVAQAAQDGQLVRVSKWLNEGGPINARDVFQCSLLHLAAGAGQAAVVQELIKRGADLNVRNLATTFSALIALNSVGHQKAILCLTRRKECQMCIIGRAKRLCIEPVRK